MKYRRPQCRAGIPRGPVTPEQVRDLMRIGLKSDEELHPDFSATGEKLSGGVESRHANHKVKTPSGREDSAQTNDQVNRRPASCDSGSSAPPAQPNIFNMAHAFKEVEKRFLGPRK